jgi:lanosterol synthase
MAAKYPHRTVIEKGISLLLARQQKNGEWKQEAIEGVFNHNCMISYPNFKFIFPIWCLNRYHQIYE